MAETKAAPEKISEEKIASLKEQRIRKICLSYYSRGDIRKAIYEFSKNRECVPRYFEGFGKRPDAFQYDSDILSYAKKGATSFHCSEEIWSDPLELSTELKEEEIKKLRIGWDLLIDIDCKYIEYSKKAANAIIQALKINGVDNVGLKFSVTGETPVLIQTKKETNLIPLQEAINLFKKGEKISILSLGSNKLVKFSEVYDSLEHTDKIYDILHENSKVPIKTTAHHSVFIFQDGEIIQKKVSELKKGDFLVTFNSNRNPAEKSFDYVSNSFSFASNQFDAKILTNKIKINEQLMRLIGYYLAEGHVTNTINQVGFSFNRKEEDYIQDCVSLLESITKRKISIRHPNTNSTQILIHSKEWASFFENYCGKSKGKHIPPFSWNLSKPLFLEMLKGYLRGDGYKVGEYELVAKSVAHRLVRELVWLCKLNGISCSLSYEKNKPHLLPQGNFFKGSFVYIISIPKSEIQIPEFVRVRNKFSPFPRERTFPISGLKQVYKQIKPKKFLSHRVEQVTLRKERANLERIKKVIIWFKEHKSIKFNEESKKIIKNYESLFNSDIGVIKVKNINPRGEEIVFDVSVKETESFFGGDYPLLLHNSGGKGFHIIVPFKAFPAEMSGKKTPEMFPEWPRLICNYLKEQSREFLEKDLYSSEDMSVLSKLKKGIRCERCKSMSEKAELINFLCSRCKTKMENLTTSFQKKRKIRCPNCQIEMTEIERIPLYQCKNCQLDSRKNPENFNEAFERIDVFDVLGLDVILVSPRHLFRMPYSLHEKTALASIVLDPAKVMDFDMIRDADPLKVQPINFMPNSRAGEAKDLLRKSIEFKPIEKQKTLEEIKNPKINEAKTSMGNKKFNDFTIKNLTPDLYPPTITKILTGMKSDGRKRALFILLSFFKSLKLSDEELESQINAWNVKNSEPLKTGYIKSQIIWYSRLKQTRLPPNFDKMYYKDIGFPPTPEEIAVKNPVSWVIKKAMSRDWRQNKNKENKKIEQKNARV